MPYKDSVLKTNDYEKYELILPYRFLAGRRKKQFLSSELEKLHPCFSDDFSFDSAFKKFTRAGLKTDVLVINKRKLAEYETKRKFSGLGFRLEKNDEKSNKRFFVSKKIHSLTFGLCIIFAGLILFFVSGAVLGKRNAEERGANSSGTTAAERFVSSPRGAPAAATASSQTSASAATDLQQRATESCGSLFFSGGRLAEGELESFVWVFDGGRERVEAEVSGVFPERFSEISERFGNCISQINYENGVPHFKVAFTDGTRNAKQQTAGSITSTPVSSASLAIEASYSRDFRKIVLENGVELVSEKTYPYSIEFLCNSQSQVFSKLSEYLLQNHIFVSAVSIKKGESGKLFATISVLQNLSGGENFGIDISILQNNLSYFFSKSNKPLSVTKRNLYVPKNPPVKNAVKIGEIKKAGGNSIIYYKTPEGKIIFDKK